jgi:hypothetical protein
MSVWICQCLCPDRHAMLATAGEADTATEVAAVRTELRRNVVRLLESGVLNGWCAICGAHRATWRYELGRTKWATLEEAMPHLRQLEAQNMLTNLIHGDTHLTQKPN